MSDFALDTTGDFVVKNDGYATAPSLETQVKYSLLIRRGQWWADPAWGSDLYLLIGQPINDDLLRQVERHTKEALAFMVEQGKASEIQAVAETNGNGKNVSLDITVIRGSEAVANVRFDQLWDEITQS